MSIGHVNGLGHLFLCAVAGSAVGNGKGNGNGIGGAGTTWPANGHRCAYSAVSGRIAELTDTSAAIWRIR
ncbi:hypothetical protein, partial [Bacillus sp. 3255]|uniref:hypothetical protein n=1 Tax=Bacillus sp. 3255 TaxID=2817904 RepID=UPI002857E610